MVYRICTPTYSGTDRQIWNFVRNFFIPAYTIDVDGNYVDNRFPTDDSRINAEAAYDASFALDLSDYLTYSGTRSNPDSFEDYLGWRNKYGTKAYGNLPQYKKSEHTGNCFVGCPYDDYDSERLTSLRLRHLLGDDDNGLLETNSLTGQFVNPIPATLDGVTLKVAHVQDGREYFMRPGQRGGWGYECTWSGCPYEQVHGTPYFYK